jgi:hypothetical protein
LQNVATQFVRSPRECNSAAVWFRSKRGETFARIGAEALDGRYRRSLEPCIGVQRLLIEKAVFPPIRCAL